MGGIGGVGLGLGQGRLDLTHPALDGAHQYHEDGQ
jgi:hypothetical protein